MRLPVTLKLQPSRRLSAALVLAHAAAFGGVMPTDIPPAATLFVALALAGALLLSLRKVRRPPFAALSLRADGQVDASREDGSSATFRVLSDTTVLSWLVVLRLRGEEGVVALTLPPDAIDGGHRELRLWLRYKASATA